MFRAPSPSLLVLLRRRGHGLQRRLRALQTLLRRRQRLLGRRQLVQARLAGGGRVVEVVGQVGGGWAADTQLGALLERNPLPAPATPSRCPSRSRRTSTEAPRLREPPVSVPPGLKSSPSSVMQRVDTSRAKASFLAVAASCRRRYRGAAGGGGRM